MKTQLAKRRLNFLRVAPGGAPVDTGPDKYPDQDSISVDGTLPDDSTTVVVAGYLGCTELPPVSNSLGDDGLTGVRSCLRRLWTEHSICSLVLVEAAASGVQLCGDTGAVLASYPAETLAFSALCPDDDKLFGLVTVCAGAGHTSKDDKDRVRTSCHAFAVDPELCSHEAHRSIAKQFSLECIPQHNSMGCLQFPPTVQRLLQLVVALQGDGTEPEALANAHPHTDCVGVIGNLPEDASDKVLLVSLGASPCTLCRSWNPVLVNGCGCSLDEPHHSPALQWEQMPSFFRKSKVHSDEAASAVVPWFSSDAEWTPSTEQHACKGSSVCKEKLPPESQTAADHEEKQPKRLFFPDRVARELTRGKQRRHGGWKSSRFGALGLAFPLPRRSVGLSKRLSATRSLDDLESAAVSGVGLKGGVSETSLASSASLPNGPGLRQHQNQPVASWATGFERLLQDPEGVRCFSEFLKKEFSEENILFWQACESFSHVPESDKKQLSQKACEIYNKFLSSRATTPVNIDRQAQLADDVLNAPRPDMFQEPQLQIFNLMKFDSYARFLRSSMYQECMLAEVEGCSLPADHRTSGSPERLSLIMPRKEAKKLNSGKVKSHDCKEEHADKKRGIFSLRNRNTSFGKGPKKSDIGDSSHDVPSSNGRRESRGSLSSGASLELGSGSSFGKVEGDTRTSVATCEKEKAPGSCTVNLPDGSRCHLPIRPGLSIRELLLGLCEKRCINLAAVDLFLAGGDKPLVLDQDSMTLSSRDLRLEKRTLFRLDLVPINRSVGLKAKPTKPVTEVLRPVVAKYGLRLSDLEARISGDEELLDLGRPISCLDGLRVVLDVVHLPAGRDLSARRAPPLMVRSRSTAGDEKAVNARGGNGSAARLGEKSKQKKINIEEAEEFFELLSKAQSSRADDQRGLLSKQNLVLPDFLRLSPEPTPAPAAPACSTPASRRSALSASRQSQSLDSALLLSGHTPSSAARPLKTSSPPGEGGDAPFPMSLSPIRAVEEENVADLTLVGEGDMSSPNSTLLPPSPTSLTPPPPCQEDIQDCSGAAERGGGASVTGPQDTLCPRPSTSKAIDVDGVRLEEAAIPADESSELNLSLEGLVAELRGRRGRTRAGVYVSSEPAHLLSVRTEDTENTASKRTSRPTFL